LAGLAGARRAAGLAVALAAGLADSAGLAGLAGGRRAAGLAGLAGARRAADVAVGVPAALADLTGSRPTARPLVPIVPVLAGSADLVRRAARCRPGAAAGLAGRAARRRGAAAGLPRRGAAARVLRPLASLVACSAISSS
jgi:hypothetical protein